MRRWQAFVVLIVSFGLVLAAAIACGELLRLAEDPDGATGLDSSVTTWVVAHRADALTSVARVLSALGSQTVLIPVTGVLALALLARRRYLLTAWLILVWGGALLLYNLTKTVVGRPRPPSSIWLTDVRHTKSFPSGHATQSMATFLALAAVSAAWLTWPRRPGRVVAVILAVGVGWSRVYLGVHWTTDVGAGWLIGLAWFAIVARLAGAAGAVQPSAPDAGLRDGSEQRMAET